MSAAAPPQQVAPDVHLVTVGRCGVLQRLLRRLDGWSLVDAGWASSAEAIRTAAESVFGPDARPAAILLTHIHPDHSGSAGALARSWRVPVYVHADELPMAAGRYLPQYAMPLDRWVVAPLHAPAAVQDPGADRGGEQHHRRGPSPGPAGGVPGLRDWEWVPTPGHTPGHVAYLRRRDGVLIAGDAALTVDLNSVGGVLFGRQRWRARRGTRPGTGPRPSGPSRCWPRWNPGCSCPATADRSPPGTTAQLQALAQGARGVPTGGRKLAGLLPRYARATRIGHRRTGTPGCSGWAWP